MYPAEKKFAAGLGGSFGQDFPGLPVSDAQKDIFARFGVTRRERRNHDGRVQKKGREGRETPSLFYAAIRYFNMPFSL